MPRILKVQEVGSQVQRRRGLPRTLPSSSPFRGRHRCPVNDLPCTWVIVSSSKPDKDLRIIPFKSWPWQHRRRPRHYHEREPRRPPPAGLCPIRQPPATTKRTKRSTHRHWFHRFHHRPFVPTTTKPTTKPKRTTARRRKRHIHYNRMFHGCPSGRHLLFVPLTRIISLTTRTD